MPPPIAVTGAGGFIAGFIVEQLLEAGHTVHGTVRDPKADKNQFLLEVAKRHPKGTLKMFAADLEKEGSFDAAFEGCDVVIHTAAVVKNYYEKDPIAEVVGPTVNGVANVIGSCKRQKVQRVVYTSSVSTILCAEQHRKAEYKGTKFTEDQWVTHVTPTYGTYNYAKIEAEKKAEELWQGEFVSILPAWCIGPLQHGSVKAASSQAVIHTLLTKQFGKHLAPRMFIHWVDVRDVAAAHVFAATNRKVPNGRYAVAGPENVSTAILAKELNTIDKSLAVPERMMPWGVMWTASWWDKRLTSHFLYEKAVPAPAISSAKIEAAGFKFKHGTSLQAVLKDALTSFRHHGVLPPAAPAPA